MTILVSIVFAIIFVAIIYLQINSAKIKGKIGENTVSFILGKLGPEYKTYNDVLIRNGDWTSQIDHIVISPFGIFVIETKNYKGWIYGGANQVQWTQNIWGKKTYLSNPIRQNQGHIIALKKILPYYTSEQYKSIIVFSSQAELKTNLPTSLNVIYTWQLLSRIKSFTCRILSDKYIQEIETQLQNQMILDKEVEKIHVSNVRQNIMRKAYMINKGYCPRCGAKMVLRNSKYGSFYGCSNYPKCTFTHK